MDNKVIGNIVGVPNPRSDWAQEDKTKADYIKNKPSIYTTEQVDSLLLEKVDKLSVDSSLSEQSENPVKNKVVTEYLYDLRGQATTALIKANEAIVKDNMIVTDNEIEAIGGVPLKVYVDGVGEMVIDHEVPLKDIKAREALENKADIETFTALIQSTNAHINDVQSLAFRNEIKINNLQMQKIFEVTTTEEAVDNIVISQDVNGNSFQLDKVYVYITLPSALTAGGNWCCYVNNNVNVKKCLYYFSANTTGLHYIANGERMCENLWFTQKFSNLSANVHNNALQSSYTMEEVDYITKLDIRCKGLPAGSTIIVCGRKVVE